MSEHIELADRLKKVKSYKMKVYRTDKNPDNDMEYRQVILVAESSKELIIKALLAYKE